VTRTNELLGPLGPLAQTLEAYEAREGQLVMALAVERALGEERVLFCEAGTGTGKTLAYLLPALLSGKKVVISTATRALQQQIVGKDLPLIERTFGIEPRVAVMKGLANYVCRRRYLEFANSAEGLRPGHSRALAQVSSWVDESDTGDVSELAALAEDDPIWREITASSETRIGAACAHYDACFVTRMKREAEAAQLVIVNHHLFFADLALRGPHPGRVIPDYDAVIFDEAHQLEDVATSFFGIRVSRGRIDRLLRDAARGLSLAGLSDPLLSGTGGDSLLKEVGYAADQLFAELARGAAGSDTRITLEPDGWQGPLQECWHGMDNALEALAALLEASRGRLASGPVRPGAVSVAQIGDALEVSARRAEQLREQLAAIVEGGQGRVAWFEAGAKNAALSSSPIDLSSIFRARVFESIPSVVLTSATLASAGPRPLCSTTPRTLAEERGRTPFAFVRSRLGLLGSGIEVNELVVASPFDFERRALLYTPHDLPPPNAAGFVEAAARRIGELVDITNGGAFVLTTSKSSLRALHALLSREHRGRKLLVQGQMPKGSLIAAFRAAEDAVLVATLSFWEGVDVPGRALRLVVLEKIPFPVPSDPIVRARGLALEAEGGNPFMDYHVPTAALILKQGFGRLIRTRSDAGIVALLDERVHRRGYGARLLAALPPARQTADLTEVQKFWERVEST